MDGVDILVKVLESKLRPISTRLTKLVYIVRIVKQDVNEKS